MKFVHKTYTHLNFYIIEDGAGVCVSDWKTVSEKWNYIRGFNKIYDDVKGLYLYTPDLMCVELGYEMHVLPKVDKDDPKLVAFYNKIFDYDADYKFPDFVFVEQSFPVDRIKNNDFDFMRSTSNIVGYENLFIKIHPRNRTNRSFSYGLSKPIECAWPFEVMLLNCNDEKKTFITVNSGSLISSRVLFQQEIRTIFLYKAVTGAIHYPHSTKIFTEYMDKFAEKYKSTNLIVPQTLEQYEDILMLIKKEL